MFSEQISLKLSIKGILQAVCSHYVYKSPLLKSKESHILIGHAILSSFPQKIAVKIHFLSKIGAPLDCSR